MPFTLFPYQILLSYKNRRKAMDLERNLTYSEFLAKAREVFGLRISQAVFLQRFDEVWGERVDVDDMKQIINKDKLFLLDVCAPSVYTVSTVCFLIFIFHALAIIGEMISFYKLI